MGGEFRKDQRSRLLDLWITQPWTFLAETTTTVTIMIILIRNERQYVSTDEPQTISYVPIKYLCSEDHSLAGCDMQSDDVNLRASPGSDRNSWGGVWVCLLFPPQWHTPGCVVTKSSSVSWSDVFYLDWTDQGRKLSQNSSVSACCFFERLCQQKLVEEEHQDAQKGTRLNLELCG